MQRRCAVCDEPAVRTPHQILWPVPAQAANLPHPLRKAMQAAFAMTVAAARDLLLIASKPTVNEAVT
jgi:hypothetical protein